jgi:Uma2 family endonuclease
MATASVLPTASLADSVWVPAPEAIYRLRVDEYERIGEMLNDPSRVELLNGFLMWKMAKNPEHSWSTKQLVRALETRLPPGWTSRQEQPVQIPDYDEPEPDVAIVRGLDDDYVHRTPTAADVALLVEVSAATLDRDRMEKLPRYAKGNIPVSWIVNLVDRQVEVYTDPGPTGYASRHDFPIGQQVPVVIDGRQIGQIPVADIMPKESLDGRPA